MQTVPLAETVAVAHLVQGVLREEGIESVLEGEALWHALGRPDLEELMPLAVRVLRDGDRDRALRILEERRQAFGGAGGRERVPGEGTASLPEDPGANSSS
jgi:hypothetical protein